MPELLKSHKKDLGGFFVTRVLPNINHQMIGPFIFFDHMGPAKFSAGKGIDVRPHPHIGIATITYLFEGSILHRDSLGFEQEIKPGDINLMTAGSGIVHSERETQAVRNSIHHLDGLQLWFALPDSLQEINPAFDHYPKNELPVFEHNGATVFLMSGELFSKKSPVKTYSPMFYADVKLPHSCSIETPSESQETGIYVINGEIIIGTESYQALDFIFIAQGEMTEITAQSDAQLILIGGEPFQTKRYIWWNFVSNSKERIDQAKSDWKNGSFGKVPGDDEYIPLPDK
ncbi:MAG: pirin family protein [Marinicellaceae bacterium]